MFYENYRIDYPVLYIFHQLLESAKGFRCFDYPYTMKITYPHFDAQDRALADLFDDFCNNFLPAEKVRDCTGILSILGEFQERIELAGHYNILADFRHKMEEAALRLYDEFFGDAEMFYLHRDLHRRNLPVIPERSRL